MIAKFGKGDDKAYQKWLNSYPDGFIWNADHQCLHRASCRYMAPKAPVIGGKRRVSKIAPKHCAATKEELLNEYPNSRDPEHHCGLCTP